MATNDKKQTLYELMKKYVDQNNCIDISTFRRENPNEYSLLPHYFGGINQAIEYFGWVKISKVKSKNGEKLTLRNKLAYDMLKKLREDNTLESIANKYGVTRPAINQLYKALEANSGE